MDLGHGVDAVGGVVVAGELARLDDAAVVLRDFDDEAFTAILGDGGGLQTS